jgi:hypothetical protein
MNISREEALASLAAIQQTRAKMKNLAGMSGYFLIIWGAVWFAGCLGNQYLPVDQTWIIWAPGCTAGWILSAVLGIYLGKHTRSKTGGRQGFFFLALFGFAAFWFFLMQPASLKQDALFIMTIFMFGGVIAGIMERQPASIISSLALAVLMVTGYYLVPAYFFLWAAIFCGLGMIGIGIAVRVHWR